MAIDMDNLKDRMTDFVDQASDVAEDFGEKARPYAEQAREWAVGMMDRAFDFLEERTGTDLDKDGVIGAAVREAAEIEVLPSADGDGADGEDGASEDPIVEDPDE